MHHPDDVILWPDETWCYRSELEEMSHMSDDYLVLRVDSPKYREFFLTIEEN